MSFIINPYAFTSGPPGGGGYGIESWTNSGAAVIVGGGRYGWAFTVGADDLSVDRLRHYKRGPNEAVWRIMIHRNTDNAVIASADISTAAEGWTEQEISPVVLAAGVAYTISARAISGDVALYRNPTGISYASGIAVSNDGVFGGADDNRPTSNSSHSYTPPADFGFTT